MNKTERTLTYLINLSFFLYFLILLIERVLSVALSIANGINLFADGFFAYVYLLVFISIGGWLIWTILFCRENVKSLFRFNEGIRFEKLCVGSAILLLSGMVHTEYTIAGIQFASYGILIVGLLLQTVLCQKNCKSRLILWLSFAYLVAFSMAIPVMYRSLIEAHVFFHIAEAITAIALVGVFAYFEILLFRGTEDLFIIWPLLVMVGLDALLITLRWPEEKNWFVLIFASLSLVLFLVGFVLKRARSRPQNKRK